MRTFFCVLIILISVPLHAALVTPNGRVTSSVLIRPSPGEKPVGQLYPGESLEYIESVKNYHVVKRGTGEKGYVSKAYTTIIESSASFIEDGLLKMSFIDVGQGDCTLISCPNGKNILIDAGSLSSASPDVVREYLLAHLNSKTPKINTLVVTHPDADHYNLLHSY